MTSEDFPAKQSGIRTDVTDCDNGKKLTDRAGAENSDLPFPQSVSSHWDVKSQEKKKE